MKMTSKEKLLALEPNSPSHFGYMGKKILGETLGSSFSYLVTSPKLKDEMLLGIEGLPEHSAKLVEMGIYVINGKYVELCEELKKVVRRSSKNEEIMLKRLTDLANKHGIEADFD
jgi:hypothetical protein